MCKRIKLICKKLADNSVLLEGIENMLSIKEICGLENGEEILRIYKDGDYMFHHKDDTIMDNSKKHSIAVVYHPSFSGRKEFKFNGKTILSEEKFGLLLVVMKEIGKRFSNIKEEVEKASKDYSFIVTI